MSENHEASEAMGKELSQMKIKNKGLEEEIGKVNSQLVMATKQIERMQETLRKRKLRTEKSNATEM